MADNTVLVTGGAGYVGSHACKALAAAGYLPVTYDNLSRGHRDFVKWGPLETGDICDRARLDAVIAAHRPSAVMHFAAVALVGESIANPQLYFRNNAEGSQVLVDAIVHAGVARLIVSGSCAVYGVPEAGPITEQTRRKPINPYGESKRMMEDSVTAAGRDHGLHWTVLRYFNAAGADPDGEVGERHDPETHLIPNMLKAAADGSAFHLNGADYPTPDGTCIRDYVHVRDLARAHVMALRRLERTPGGFVFNLGCGTGYSVREVLSAGERITGRLINVSVAPRREGDPPILVADTRAARETLEWTPEADLEQQIRDAWRWHQATC